MALLKTIVWTLDEALTLVRELQPYTRQFGYHLALGGGVLNNGESRKDLDLYFLPLDNGKLVSPDKMLDLLQTHFHDSGVSLSDPAYDHLRSDYHYKYEFTYRANGRRQRIDVFIV